MPRPHDRTSVLSLLIFGTLIWVVLCNIMVSILYAALLAHNHLPPKWRSLAPSRAPGHAPTSTSSAAPGPPVAHHQRALLESGAPTREAARAPRYPAYVIALDPAAYDTRPLARLDAVRNLTLIAANNGTASVATLPLYTRHLLRHGRSEHHQLGNTAAVGCLLSHADAWARAAQSGQTSIVFEEDTVVAPDSDFKLTQFIASMEPYQWDLVMLDTGHLNSGGPWSAAGPLGANCSQPGACEWFGTRAYILRPAAARRLLVHMHPPVVQADAVISLVYEFDSAGFRMYWTRYRIFGFDMIRRSTIFDGCIKCYLPVGGPAYVLAGAVLAVLIFWHLHRRGSPGP